jgi:aromatic-L-amino-acid decarboxylase
MRVWGTRTPIVRSGVDLAAQFAGWVRADDRFKVLAPHPFSLVCFRLRAGDEASAELLARVNATGPVYLTHARVRGHYTLRLAIGSPQTTHRHVADAWQLISETASALATAG